MLETFYLLEYMIGTDSVIFT